MKKLRAGILGATGMVGQRFILLLQNHPYFELTALCASGRSANKPYREAVEGRWKMTEPIPESVLELPVMDASDIRAVSEKCDFVFSAVVMPKDELLKLEESYAKAEIPVISNNSAHRATPDVPMLIPEINPQHAEIIAFQKQRLGTRRGFIAVKPNCSIQGYVPLLTPLLDFEPTRVAVCTYQAISGAGKTFREMPEIVDNVIPYIGGEEEKSELEPLKIWGRMEGGVIVPAESPVITAQCLRVPVSDGHMAACFVSFAKKPSKEEIIARWRAYEGEPQTLGLPSAPKPFLTYFEEPDRPQTKLDRMVGNGMGVSVGRLREDSVFDYKFIGLAHNTLRGAAGGGLLSAEFLYRKGYLD